MRFKTVVIENFLSIGKAEIEFEDGHLILIEGRNLDEGGSNGSGKSSLWDAISWAIFGQTVRGLKGDEVINRAVGQNCAVRLSFDYKGILYSIFRYRGHKTMGDKLIIRRGSGDEAIELGTLALTQDWLLSELGIDFELFRCTVLFAQEETFNFVNATNKQQKEILSKIMKVDYAEYLEKAKDKYTEAEDELSSIDGKLEVLRSHVVDDPAAVFDPDIAAWELEQKKFLKEAAMRLKELGMVEFKGDADRVAKIRKAGAALREQLAKNSETLIALSASFFAKKSELKKLDESDGKCPTCGSVLESAEEAEKIEAKMAELSAETGRLKLKIAEHEEAVKPLNKKIYALEEMLATAMRDIGAEKENAAQVEATKTKISQLKKRENPFIKRREEAIEKQAQIKVKIEELSSNRTKIREDMPYYEFWTRAFGDSGIKSFVFDLICATLTNRANNYLNKMTGGAVTISFDTQTKLKSGELRDKFDCVVAKGGKRVPYISYSGGEKRRISLAVDMALSDLMSDYYGSKFNFVVFDEQTNYLDRSGRESFMNLLKDVAREKTVFVVDHDAEFKAMFDESWTVTKQNGISCLV